MLEPRDEQTENFRHRIFDCTIHVPHWKLQVALLARREDRDLGNVMETATAGALAHLRQCFPDGDLGRSSTVAAIRRDLERLGIDPRRHPPSSELVIRNLLENAETIRGPLAWEFLNILIAKSHAPWSALDRSTLNPPLEFRQGKVGETVAGETGEFDCAGLPVLADRDGVKASPWSPSPRSKLEGSNEPVFICYVPEDLFRMVGPRAHVGRSVWLTWAYRFVFERTCSCGGSTG